MVVAAVVVVVVVVAAVVVVVISQVNAHANNVILVSLEFTLP